MKYVLFTLHRMTPDQLKMNPIKPIIKVNPSQELDRDEGESSKDQEESIKDEEESITSTEMSEKNSTSDIPIEDTEESKPTETSQILLSSNPSQELDRDEGDSSKDQEESIKDEEESITSTEMSEKNSTSDIPIEDTEESKPTETSQILLSSIHPSMMKMIHLKTSL